MSSFANSPLNRTVPVDLVDLVVDGQQLALRQFLFQIAIVGVNAQRARLHLLADRRQTVLGDVEDHRDRLQLRDHHQAVGIGGVDDVALIHQPQPDASGQSAR